MVPTIGQAQEQDSLDRFLATQEEEEDKENMANNTNNTTSTTVAALATANNKEGVTDPLDIGVKKKRVGFVGYFSTKVVILLEVK